MRGLAFIRPIAIKASYFDIDLRIAIGISKTPGTVFILTLYLLLVSLLLSTSLLVMSL